MTNSVPQNQKNSASWTRGLFWLWLLVCASFAVLLWRSIDDSFKVETDLTALLPDTGSDQFAREVNRTITKNNENKFILILTGNNQTTLVRATQNALARLNTSDIIDIETIDRTTNNGLIRKLFEHRFYFLTDRHRQLLEKQQTQPVVDDGMHLHLGFRMWFTFGLVEEDPLGLFNEWLTMHLEAKPETIPQPGYLLIEPKDQPWSHTVIEGNLLQGSLNMEAQQSLAAVITQIEEDTAQIDPNVQLSKSGLVFHASAAAQQAKKEILFISIGSIIGIVLLFYLSFRSLMPLLLGLGSIACGCLIACVISLAVFERLHILTLVFGASLTGVAVDYALHYLVHAATDEENDRLSLRRRLLPGLSLGLLTSVIGFACLLQAPMPGLKQIATFSIVGLMGAWLTVIFCFPFFSKYLNKKSNSAVSNLLSLIKLQNLLDWLAAISVKSRIIGGLALLAIALITASLLSTVSEDVRTLYQPNEELLAADQFVQQVLPDYSISQFFLVTGDSAQQLLENEEELQRYLSQAKEANDIEDYLCISQFLPSVRTQRHNYDLMQQIYGADGVAFTTMRNLDFDAESITNLKSNFENAEGNFLLPDELLDQVTQFNSLWLGQIDGKHASIVMLSNIKNLDALLALDESLQSVQFIDRVAELSSILHQQSNAAAKQILWAYIVVLAILLLKYRSPRAALIVLVPFTSSAVTLALLSAVGIPITLFHIFALFLILGLGMDYGIFLKESHDKTQATLLAIILSALTSCLSFGLLSLSSTPMVSAFGASILIGSVANLLLATWLLPPYKSNKIYQGQPIAEDSL